MTKKNTSLFVTAVVALGGIAMTGCQQTSQYSSSRGVKASDVAVTSSTTRTSASSQTSSSTSRMSVASAESAPGGLGAALPPGAKPGDCFTRVVVPPTYKTVQERVLVEAAGETIETIPAQYETREERVVTKPESYRLEVIPATYKTVEERVEIRPAITNVVQIPAQYETVQERVLVSPERVEWKKGSGAIQKIDGATGEIMCLVTIPAEYNTVTRRKLVSPATTKQEVTPAQYETIKRTVVETPETTRRVAVAAEYGTIRRSVLVKPATTRRIPTEAKYDTVTKQVRVSGGTQDWRQILCETNVTPEVVANIQKALQAAGHNPGAVNGQLNASTLNAVREYQVKNNLATGGLTYVTLQRLGVSL